MTLKHILLVILARGSMRDLSEHDSKLSKKISKRKLCLKKCLIFMCFCPKARCIVFAGQLLPIFDYYMKPVDLFDDFPVFSLNLTV